MIEVFIVILVIILIGLVLQVRLIVQGRTWPEAPRQIEPPPRPPPPLPPQVERYETTKLGRASISDILEDTYKEK